MQREGSLTVAPFLMGNTVEHQRCRSKVVGLNPGSWEQVSVVCVCVRSSSSLTLQRHALLIVLQVRVLIMCCDKIKEIQHHCSPESRSDSGRNVEIILNTITSVTFNGVSKSFLLALLALRSCLERDKSPEGLTEMPRLTETGPYQALFLI